MASPTGILTVSATTAAIVHSPPLVLWSVSTVVVVWSRSAAPTELDSIKHANIKQFNYVRFITCISAWMQDVRVISNKAFLDLIPLGECIINHGPTNYAMHRFLSNLVQARNLKLRAPLFNSTGPIISPWKIGSAGSKNGNWKKTTRATTWESICMIFHFPTFADTCRDKESQVLFFSKVSLSTDRSRCSRLIGTCSDLVIFCDAGHIKTLDCHHYQILNQQQFKWSNWQEPIIG